MAHSLVVDFSRKGKGYAPGLAQADDQIGFVGAAEGFDENFVHSGRVFGVFRADVQIHRQASRWLVSLAIGMQHNSNAGCLPSGFAVLSILCYIIGAGG